MEQSSPVGLPSDAVAAKPAPSSWNSAAAAPSFVGQMEDLLGAHAEPDPLFFVDSWTIGLEAATENLQARQHLTTNHNTSTFRAFDFSVPLVFMEECTPDFSAGMPLGFREAYGVPARSFPSDVFRSMKSAAPEPVPEQSLNLPDPNQPLTLQSACCLLGVAPTDSREQIKTAYRQLVRRYHPDRLASSSSEARRVATDRMITINQAYRLICDSSF